MGLLTKMNWPDTKLLHLLDEAEASPGETFDVIHLGLNSGKDFVVAVIHGDTDHVSEIAEYLQTLKQEREN